MIGSYSIAGAAISGRIAYSSAPANQTVTCTGIDSLEAFGTSTVSETFPSPLPQTVTCSAIASGEAFGTAGVSVIGGAISEVFSQRTSIGWTSGTSASLAYPGSVTAGNLLICSGASYGSISPADSYIVTDTLSNSWTVLVGIDMNGVRTWIAYCRASSSGACTVTVDPQGGETGSFGLNFALSEFAGAAYAAFEAAGTGSAGFDTAPTDTVVTATDNDLVVAVMAHDDGTTTINVGTGFTEIAEIEDATTAQPYSTEFKIVTTAGSYAGDFTTGAAVFWTAQSAAFRPASVGEQVVSLSGIASSQAFGTASVSVGSGVQTVSPTAIASGEAFGAAKINLTVTGTGIASGQAFGAASVTPGVVALSPSGIASAEAFGAASVTIANSPQTVTGTGIASGEAFGAAKINLTVTGTGIASGQAFGAASVTAAGLPSTVTPSGIGSVEAFGVPAVRMIIRASGIASTEAFGTASCLVFFYVSPIRFDSVAPARSALRTTRVSSKFKG